MDLRDCQRLASLQASLPVSERTLPIAPEDWTPNKLVEVIFHAAERANVLGVDLAELIEGRRSEFFDQHPWLLDSERPPVVPGQIRKVTVYAASSSRVPRIYLEEAESLGRLLARQGWVTVFGGGSTGLMGALSRGVRAQGGTIAGVILDRFTKVMDEDVPQMKTVSTMRSRKRGLEEMGDAFVCLPGGLGTLEELFETLSFRHLGFHDKPLVFCNTAGFWNDTLRQLERCFEEEFIPAVSRRTYQVASNAEEAIQALRDWKPPRARIASEAAELGGAPA